jgi:hypothetical protein
MAKIQLTFSRYMIWLELRTVKISGEMIFFVYDIFPPSIILLIVTGVRVYADTSITIPSKRHAIPG